MHNHEYLAKGLFKHWTNQITRRRGFLINYMNNNLKNNWFPSNEKPGN